jgi:hypothetical protein
MGQVRKRGILDSRGIGIALGLSTSYCMTLNFMDLEIQRIIAQLFRSMWNSMGNSNSI